MFHYFIIHKDGGTGKNISLTTLEVLRYWLDEHDLFMKRFLEPFAQSQFQALLWETPPITMLTLNCPFEFVLIDAPDLALRSADLSSFAV